MVQSCTQKDILSFVPIEVPKGNLKGPTPVTVKGTVLYLYLTLWLWARHEHPLRWFDLLFTKSYCVTLEDLSIAHKSYWLYVALMVFLSCLDSHCEPLLSKKSCVMISLLCSTANKQERHGGESIMIELYFWWTVPLNRCIVKQIVSTYHQWTTGMRFILTCLWITIICNSRH